MSGDKDRTLYGVYAEIYNLSGPYYTNQANDAVASMASHLQSLIPRQRNLLNEELCPLLAKTLTELETQLKENKELSIEKADANLLNNLPRMKDSHLTRLNDWIKHNTEALKEPGPSIKDDDKDIVYIKLTSQHEYKSIPKNQVTQRLEEWKADTRKKVQAAEKLIPLFKALKKLKSLYNTHKKRIKEKLLGQLKITLKTKTELLSKKCMLAVPLKKTENEKLILSTIQLSAKGLSQLEKLNHSSITFLNATMAKIKKQLAGGADSLKQNDTDFALVETTPFETENLAPLYNELKEIINWLETEYNKIEPQRKDIIQTKAAASDGDGDDDAEEEQARRQIRSQSY